VSTTDNTVYHDCGAKGWYFRAQQADTWCCFSELCMYVCTYICMQLHMCVWVFMYEGWNFNSGNYLFTTDTK